MSKNARFEPLPDPGPSRWWRVELVPVSARAAIRAGAPIRVTLYESFDVENPLGPQRPGRALYGLRTVAQAEEIRKTGQKILDAVGNYQEYVGEYYILPRETKGEAE